MDIVANLLMLWLLTARKPIFYAGFQISAVELLASGNIVISANRQRTLHVYALLTKSAISFSNMRNTLAIRYPSATA